MGERILVTGASGFTGRYVKAALEKRGYQVIGAAGPGATGGSAQTALDLRDARAVTRLLEDARPHYVVHLAGISAVANDSGEEYYRVHLLGTLNLLEAAARNAPTLRKIVLASSAHVYGRPANDPVSEAARPVPVSHYGASKLAMEVMARTYERLPILIVRPFNYTGIGQAGNFLMPKLAAAFRKRQPEIELGDRSVVREFMDVRDVAAAYAELLASPAQNDVVNICAGAGYELDQVLDALSRLCGHAMKVRVSHALIRGNEIPRLVGSPDKLRSLVDVSFRPLDETLSWMLAG